MASRVGVWVRGLSLSLSRSVGATACRARAGRAARLLPFHVRGSIPSSAASPSLSLRPSLRDRPPIVRIQPDP
eukprot:scaffold87455_cov28-Tisochrysis_lutea.AAC.1